MVLYINCCPREASRTKKIADALVKKLGAFEELDLYALNLQPVDRARLERRDALLRENRLDAEDFSLARQFAEADAIVVAAPFWDLSFPSMLKIYVENVYITGIVSAYAEDGTPVGLCRAKKMYYVTTAGGGFDQRYSYDYFSTLCRQYFGIPETQLICAELLDIAGNDAESIVNAAIADIGAGEKIPEKAYDRRAEEALKQMRQEIEEKDALLLRTEIVAGIPLTVAALLLVVLAAFVPMADLWRVALCVFALLAIIVFCLVAIRIEQKAGYYECQNCRHRYVPGYKQVLFAPHTGRTRYMKCPRCGRKSRQKKVLTKDEEI